MRVILNKMRVAAPSPAIHMSNPDVAHLYAEHHGWLRGWLARRVESGAAAADLTQDTFVNILEQPVMPVLRQPRAFLQVVASRTQTKNQILGRDLTSDQYGNDDPTLDNYTFRSFTNADSPVTWKSMEYSYTQYLSFLPRAFQGTSVNLSYTRTYYTVVNPAVFVSGVIPNSVKGTLGWRYGRFALSVSAIWQDNSGPFLNALNRYQKENTKTDLSGSVKLTKNLSFYFAGRNIFQQSHRIMEKSAGNPDVLFRYENYGTIWSFGIRGNF